MSRHFSARARIGLRSGVGVGIDAVSTTVKRSFNGKSRRTSEVCHAAGAATRQLAPGMKTNARLTLERFARFEFGFLGRTHAMCVRAAGVRAVEKE